MSEVLALKYRPTKLDEVVGQRAAVNMLRRLEKSRFSQQFLMAGPPGCGKTTMARIAARLCGSRNMMDIYEHDAAKHSGADDIREITDLMQYKPFGKSEHKAIIIDECHALSAAAWKNLYKPIEEPPSFVTWFLCTTELNKVPAPIQTRCTKVLVKDVGNETLTELVTRVCKAEGIKLAQGVMSIVVKEAKGSPRQSLVNLASCREAKDRKEAADLLHSALETDATLELCRFLVKGGSWVKAMAIVKKLENENPEGIRVLVCNYMAQVIKGATTDDAACRVLPILDNFATPFYTSEGQAPLLRAIGRTLFAGAPEEDNEDADG